MELSGENPPAPAQSLSTAQQWAIYPRNLASLFPEVDLENYDNFLSSNAGRLFSSSTVRLVFWSARDQVDGGVNGATNRTSSRRRIVQDEITEAENFDSKLQARHPELKLSLPDSQLTAFVQEHIATGEDHVMYDAHCPT
jgi:hypothetical protein